MIKIINEETKIKRIDSYEVADNGHSLDEDTSVKTKIWRFTGVEEVPFPHYVKFYVHAYDRDSAREMVDKYIDTNGYTFSGIYGGTKVTKKELQQRIKKGDDIIELDIRDSKFIEEDNALDHIDSTTKKLLIDMALKATSPNFVEAWISRDYLKSTGSYRLILNIKIAREYEGSGDILSSVSRKFNSNDVWWDDMSVIQVDVTDWFEDANLTESATQALHHYIDDDGYVSIDNVANFVTDAYDGELDDRYSCIASIIHDYKDEGKVSTEVIDQYAGGHNLVDQ